MKKILVLTLLLVVLPYTFFPENPDWFKLDQSIGRCQAAGASTTWFGLVLWGPCRDLDGYLFFIKQNKVGAYTTDEVTLSMWMGWSFQYQLGYTSGMMAAFDAAGMVCADGGVKASVVAQRITNQAIQTPNGQLRATAIAAFASFGCHMPERQ